MWPGLTFHAGSPWAALPWGWASLLTTWLSPWDRLGGCIWPAVLGEHLSEKQVQPSYHGALRGTNLFCGRPSLKPWPCVFFPAPSSNTPGFGMPLRLISHPLLCSIASKHRGLQLLMSEGMYYSYMYHHHPVGHQYMGNLHMNQAIWVWVGILFTC